MIRHLSTKRGAAGVIGAAAVVGLAMAAVAFAAGVATYRPVIGKPISAPSQAVAGKRFVVIFGVTRSDSGAALTRGTMIGSPSIGGRQLIHSESFMAGKARVAFGVPATADGKLLKVAVTIKATGGGSSSRVATYRILAGPKPMLSIVDASVAEGDSGTTTLSLPLTLSFATTKVVSVAYATSDGTATAPADYAPTSGTVTFRPGELSTAIQVSVVGDQAIEQDETLAVTLSSSTNATIARGTATGLITNDDTAVAVTAGPYKGTLEGNALFFDVVGRYVTNFRSNYIRMDCDSGGIYVYGSLTWGTSQFVIGPDGSFGAKDSGTTTVGGRPATYSSEVAGRLAGSNASGTILESVEYDRDGAHLRCSSGQRPWTASLQG
jgi:hypothetical protein